jgi:hypothetical protein
MALAYTRENFPYEQFRTAYPDVASKDNTYLYNWYKNYQPSWSTPTTTTPDTTTPPPVAGDPAIAQIVPNSPSTQAAAGQINIADYAGQVAIDPTKAFRTDDPNTPENESMFLSDRNQAADPNATGTNIDGSQYTNPGDPVAQAMQATANTAQASQSAGTTVDSTAVAQQVDPRTAAGYNAQTTAQDVAAQDAQAAQGTVSQGAQITDTPQIDIEGAAERF